MKFASCPRCHFESYEKLKSYSFCHNCNYSPELEVRDLDHLIPTDILEEIKNELGIGNMTENT